MGAIAVILTGMKRVLTWVLALLALLVLFASFPVTVSAKSMDCCSHDTNCVSAVRCCADPTPSSSQQAPRLIESAKFQSLAAAVFAPLFSHPELTVAEKSLQKAPLFSQALFRLKSSRLI